MDVSHIITVMDVSQMTDPILLSILILWQYIFDNITVLTVDNCIWLAVMVLQWVYVLYQSMQGPNLKP